MFDVFEAFLNTDNIQVFANAATSYIMCLMKFVKGLGKWSPLFMPCDSWGLVPGWLCAESPGDRPAEHPGMEADGVYSETEDSLGKQLGVLFKVDILHCVHGIIL